MKRGQILGAVVAFVLLLLGQRLLAGCSSGARVGELHTQSQSVELQDAKRVRVEIALAAGNLELAGGAEKLMEADFAYNVAMLKPVVAYKDGTLTVREPEAHGAVDWRRAAGFQNDWGLRLSDAVPMDLSIEVGAGASKLLLAGLSLTGLDIRLGAGTYTIDLSGDWARDLDISIDAGAATVNLRLPKDIGARVQVGDGPHIVNAAGLAQKGNVYTNAAYGVSDVSMLVDMQAGVGLINLEVE